MSISNHLTGPSGLKPGTIIHAAESDLKKRAEVKGTDGGPGVSYAFLAGHVRRAESDGILKLLSLAIKRPRAGQNSSKRETRMIYSDIDLLKETRDILGE